MPALNVMFHMVGDTPLYPDTRPEDVIYSHEPIDVIGIESGMKSGKPSVMIRVILPDGKIVYAETSGALLVGAARAIAARFPDALDLPPNAPGAAPI